MHRFLPLPYSFYEKKNYSSLFPHFLEQHSICGYVHAFIHISHVQRKRILKLNITTMQLPCLFLYMQAILFFLFHSFSKSISRKNIYKCRRSRSIYCSFSILLLFLIFYYMCVSIYFTNIRIKIAKSSPRKTHSTINIRPLFVNQSLRLFLCTQFYDLLSTHFYIFFFCPFLCVLYCFFAVAIYAITRDGRLEVFFWNSEKLLLAFEDCNVKV